MELHVEREVVVPADPGEVWEALTEPERLVLDWDDGGEVVLELEEVDGGTLVRVRETSPDFAAALELSALAWAPSHA